MAWPITVVLLLPLASTGLFYFWLRGQKQLDHDQKLKSWDDFFKMIGTVTLIAGGMMKEKEFKQACFTLP